MQELNPPPQRLGGSFPVRKAPVVPALVIAAQLVCAAVLCGWAFGIPGGSIVAGSVAGGRILMQPLTAVAGLGAGAGILLVYRSRPNLARLALAIPLIVAFSALIQDLSGTSFGIDRLLFPDSVALQPRYHPGRPGVLPALSMLLLALSVLAFHPHSASFRRLTVPLACVAITAAAISGMLVPLGISRADPATRHALMSVPTAVTICLLSVGVIALRRQYAWPRKSDFGFGSATIQTCLLLCVVLPIISALAHFWAERRGIASPEMIEIVQAIAQVMLSCGLIAWAWSRIARESGARSAVNLALDAAPVSITDLDGRILRWSAGCERLYGWTSEQAIGRFQQVLTGTPPMSEAGVETLLGGIRHESETTAYRKDGAALRVLHNRQAVQSRSDIAPMIVHSMTDITARIQAERAMLVSDARLALAVDLHELGIFEWSLSTDRFVFHGHAERLFALEPGGFEGGLDDWKRHLLATFGSTFRVPGPPETWRPGRHGFRLVAVAPDSGSGLPKVVEGTAHIHHGPDEEISLIGIVMDATEREQRAEMLKSRESELRSILDTVPEAMITIDGHGRIRSFSVTAEALFGYSAEEVLGKDVRLLLPRYVRPASDPALPATTSITAGLDRQGNELPIEIAIGAANIGSERISIAFIRNLREQLAAQARMGELREQFLHASRVSAMGEMGAGLAHELNQPLTATSNLLGAIDLMMARDGDPEQVRCMLELARQEVLRAGSIIRRMRAFVAKGELEIRAEPLDELIAETIQLARSRSRIPGVRLTYRPSVEAACVLADRIQMQQVLINLINNAFDALAGLNDRQPEITLSTRQLNDAHIMISVIDNGPGLPETILNRPFEAFSSTKANGLGLGLSICRRIVEAHGGRFSMRNVPDGGAAIEFTFPSYSELELKAG
nr:PAS domain S-box protein [Novosphingobium panipatense]